MSLCFFSEHHHDSRAHQDLSHHCLCLSIHKHECKCNCLVTRSPLALVARFCLFFLVCLHCLDCAPICFPPTWSTQHIHSFTQLTVAVIFHVWFQLASTRTNKKPVRLDNCYPASPGSPMLRQQRSLSNTLLPRARSLHSVRVFGNCEVIVKC